MNVLPSKNNKEAQGDSGMVSQEGSYCCRVESICILYSYNLDFSRFPNFSRNAKKRRWVLISPGIIFLEVATLVNLSESPKLASCGKAVRLIVPLDVPRLPETRPYLATVQCSLNQVLARQSPPRHENNCRYRVDLGCAGESALSRGRIELLMHGALCDQP